MSSLPKEPVLVQLVIELVTMESAKLVNRQASEELRTHPSMSSQAYSDLVTTDFVYFAFHPRIDSLPAANRQLATNLNWLLD